MMPNNVITGHWPTVNRSSSDSTAVQKSQVTPCTRHLLATNVHKGGIRKKRKV